MIKFKTLIHFFIDSLDKDALRWFIVLNEIKIDFIKVFVR